VTLQMFQAGDPKHEFGIARGLEIGEGAACSSWPAWFSALGGSLACVMRSPRRETALSAPQNISRLIICSRAFRPRSENLRGGFPSEVKGLA
jgi:hypothetical protein